MSSDNDMDVITPIPKKKTIKTLLIILLVMIIAVPLGLLAVGTAYGEWGVDELLDLLGYIPSGILAMQNFWHALFPDYEVIPLDPNVGYWLSAIIGVFLVVGVMLLIGKLLTRKGSK